MSSVPRVATADAALDAIVEHGFAIVEDVLSRDERTELADAVARIEHGRPLGRNDFEGQRSHRLYSLIARGRPFERLAEHPLAVGVLDALLQPNWLLSNCQSIRLYPGETRQPWHTDDTFYPVPRPHAAPLGVSTIWAIDPFTAANGATEVLDASHRWGTEHPDDQPDAEMIAAEMAPGSVLIFDAALWHRGGANGTDDTRLCVTIQYCQPWLRPQESQLLIAPPEVAFASQASSRRRMTYVIDAVTGGCAHLQRRLNEALVDFEAEVDCAEEVAVVAAVGAGAAAQPAMLGKLLDVLGRAGVPVLASSQQDSNVALVAAVAAKHAERAVAAIHDAFIKSQPASSRGRRPRRAELLTESVRVG